MDLVPNIPAPAIPAGGGQSKAFEVLHMDEADFAKSLGIDTLVPENAQPRDTDGKFIAKETVLADTTLAKPAETPTEQPAVEAEKPVEEKPAEAEQPQAEKPKAPLTKFDILDTEGKPVELPDVTLQFKDNGKVVQHPLEKVVHLAQQNSHNARQVQALSEIVGQKDQQVTQYIDTIQAYETNVARMFQNPEVYEEARAAWLEANSPEKRAERAEATVQQVTQQRAAEKEAEQVAGFISGTILPSITQLAEQYDNVTEDDILGRFALYVPAYMVNGKVPPANLPKLQQFVETELASWAATVHDQRAAKANAITAEAGKSLQKERETSQALKRQVGKVLAPAGNAPQGSQPKPTIIKKASDVLNDPLFGGPES